MQCVTITDVDQPTICCCKPASSGFENLKVYCYIFTLLNQKVVCGAFLLGYRPVRSGVETQYAALGFLHKMPPSAPS